MVLCEIFEEVKVHRLRDRIVNYMNQSHGFITKIHDVDNGVDIYISDKKIASGMLLHMRIKPLISYTLYGLGKNGKRVYRNTYSIHI